MTSVSTTREIVAVLPFGAILAARLLADRLAAPRLLPALAAVGCGYLISLGVLLAHSPVPPQAQRLTNWLEAHHLRYGLGNSALGSVVTVSSDGRVALRPLRVDRHRLAPGGWEAEQSWFGPRQHDATFAALLGTPPRAAGSRLPACVRAAGRDLPHRPLHRADLGPGEPADPAALAAPGDGPPGAPRWPMARTTLWR